MENICIKDIVLAKNQSRFEFLSDEYSLIFDAIKSANVDIITQNPPYLSSGNRIFISVDTKDADDLVLKIDKLIKIKRVDNLSKISITGIGIKTNISVLYGIISRLNDIGVKILTISTSEIKISILIEEKDENIAISSLKSFNF